jgi:hypothetical protein
MQRLSRMGIDPCLPEYLIQGRQVPFASKAIRRSYMPLKDQNRLPIVGMLALNLLAFILVVKTGQLFTPDVSGFAKQWLDFLPAGVGIAFAAVVNGLLSSENKARLVFWRWSNPLPGSLAFSTYVHRDSRIDSTALRKVIDRWPTIPREQNTLWYRLYRSVENEPAVVDAHRHFLLTRDCTAIAILMLITGVPLGIWLISPFATAGTYVALLLLQYLFARQAAYNYGIRLVTTVLALKAVG